MKTDHHIRPMTPADLDDVMPIQTASYGEHWQEDRATFADKLARFPSGCFICESDGVVAGYIFSHPANLESPPTLNDRLPADLSGATGYFLHDVAVHPSHRDRGCGGALLRAALAVAARYPLVGLVAVQGSRPRWERFGFRPHDPDDPVFVRIRTIYGDAAEYMTRVQVPIPASDRAHS